MFRFQIMLVFMASSYLSFSQSDYSIKNIPSELLKNANSVLLDELIEIDITQNYKLIKKNFYAITVLNKIGHKKVHAYENYDNDTKIKRAEAFIYDGLGNEIAHYKKRHFKDVSAVSGGSLYEDNRVLYLDYTPTTYPYTLVFSSETESGTTAFIPRWFPVYGYAKSVKNSVFKLKYNPANKPRMNAKNFDGFDISIFEKPNEIVCTASNIEALKYENYSPPYEEIAAHVIFGLDRFYLKGVRGHGKNWKEFGKWRYDKLVVGLDEVPVATSEKMAQLVSGIDNKREKVKRIYEYVQNKTRYISVQLGIGGWKPYPASEVDRLSYGDCKGLTNYTKALLKTQNIESYYSVVWAGDEGKSVEKEFASMQGNHIILNVPLGEEDIWLECTNQDIPFGFLGDFTDDRDVLVITPDGGKIVHTKKYTFEDNTQENTGVIHLNAKGGMNATIQVVSMGLQYGNKYHLEKETKEDLIKSYKEQWSYINGLSIENTVIENNKDAIVFSEKLTVESPNYCSSIGNDLLFCVNVFNQSQLVPPRIANRKQDLLIPKGYTDKDQFEIILPKDYGFESLPENKVIENKFGSYSIEFNKLLENKIQYKRTIIIKKGTFPPEEYANYRSFRRTIAKLDKTKMLLTPIK